MSVKVTKVGLVDGSTGAYYIVAGYKEDGLFFRKEVVPGLEEKQPPEIQKAIKEFHKSQPLFNRHRP